MSPYDEWRERERLASDEARAEAVRLLGEVGIPVFNKMSDRGTEKTTCCV